MTDGKQVTFNVDESPSKKQRTPFMTITAKVLNTQQSTLPPMPIKVLNSLPASVFRFGTSDENETTLTFNVDSCAGMNTGNLLVHQCTYVHSTTTTFHEIPQTMHDIIM